MWGYRTGYGAGRGFGYAPGGGGGSEVAIRGVTSVGVNETNTTLDIPEGTLPGDIMLVFVTHTGSNSNANPPTGWQRYATNTSTAPRFHAFFKEYEEADGSQVTFGTGGPRQRTYHMVVLGGPVAAFGTRAEGRTTGTSHSANLLVGCEDTVQQLVFASIAADTTLAASGFTEVAVLKAGDGSQSTFIGVRGLNAGVHDTTPTVTSAASAASIVLTLAFTSRTVTPTWDVLDSFDDYELAAVPTGWTRQHGFAPANDWQVIDEASADDGRALRRPANGNSYFHALTLDALAAEDDMLVATRVRTSAAANLDAIGVALRTTGASGYRATLARGQTHAGISGSHTRTKVERVTGTSSATSLVEQFNAHEWFDFANSEWVMGAAKVEGDYVMASFWEDGKAMPALWHVTVQDDAVASGPHGVSAKLSNDVDYDWVGFAVAGA